jgi:hypothetical protein
MTKFDISIHDMGFRGGEPLAAGLKGNQVITELNLSNRGSDNGLQLPGIVALADVIPNMGAMTSLNLASNNLYPPSAKIIAACIPKCT